ncbi:MAG: HAD-IIA family hydrolase [Acidimicrobiales bacterium]
MPRNGSNRATARVWQAAHLSYALDLDGVVWLAEEPIPGAAEAVARLRGAGHDVVFVTNNSSQPVRDVESKLAAQGIPAEGDVITSAMAAAALVEPGECVLVCAGPGVVEALEQRGAVAVRDGDADAVMVGFHLDFDYERLRIASRAVRRGARLLATNADASYPTPQGPIPGGGAILAAVVVATGMEAVVAGKPHAPMAGLVRARLGDAGVMVGDRPDTDGLFARVLGYRFALVHTGVTPAGVPVDPEPDLVARDLATLVADLC